MGGAMTTHFIVHDKHDTVGVVVTEDVRPGMEVTGWVMETNATVTLKALDAIPLGHKIALKDIAEGETVLKYGADIGKAVKPIARGGHAHVHNMKTKRW
jgi:(2R)-sulfolactate sulfo-lyase subunit alpha